MPSDRLAVGVVGISGVQSQNAPAVYESWRSGRAITNPPSRTFAGGIATSYPGGFTFDYWREHIDDIALVGDDDILDAAVVMLRETGHMPEGAGATGLAALLADPERYRGRTVVILLTGSNAEPVIWERLHG